MHLVLLLILMCIEKLIRFDCLTESLNVSDDGRAVESRKAELMFCLCPLAQTARAVFLQAASARRRRSPPKQLRELHIRLALPEK
jgi:hypothetical protein